MLAMDARTPRGVRLPALSLTTIASMLAPTVFLVRRTFQAPIKKPAEAGSSTTITTPCRQQSMHMADHP